MAQRTLPGTGPATVQEAGHEDLTAPSTGNGFIGHPGDTPIVYADGGANVKFRTGKAAALRGSRWDADAADMTVAVSAVPVGPARIDLAVIRFDRDHLTVPWTAYPFVIEGTPGSGAPAPTQAQGPTGTWDLPCALITRNGGATVVNPGDVTRTEWFLAPEELRCTAATRPPHNDGLLIYETDTKRVLVSSDGSWVTVFDPAAPVTWSSLPGKPSTFPPSAHNHSGADISTGSVGIARLPVGTGSSQVAAGNHTHASPATVSNQQDAVLTTTSTSFTESAIAGGALAAVVFTAPPSGRVLVHNSAQLANNGAGNLLGFVIRTGGTVGSGSTVVPASDNRSVHVLSPAEVNAGVSYLVTGLTPGSTYNIRQSVRVTGSVGSFLYRRIIVAPAA